jgi:hypothetical protein
MANNVSRRTLIDYFEGCLLVVGKLNETRRRWLAGARVLKSGRLARFQIVMKPNEPSVGEKKDPLNPANVDKESLVYQRVETFWNRPPQNQKRSRKELIDTRIDSRLEWPAGQSPHCYCRQFSTVDQQVQSIEKRSPHCEILLTPLASHLRLKTSCRMTGYFNAFFHVLDNGI